MVIYKIFLCSAWEYGEKVKVGRRRVTRSAAVYFCVAKISSN